MQLGNLHYVQEIENDSQLELSQRIMDVSIYAI